MSSPSEPIASPEVVAVMRRWLGYLESGDTSSFPNIFSQSPALRVVGSDAEAWWAGQDVPVAVRALFEGVPNMTLTLEHIEAFEMGPVAWGASRSRIEVGDGSELELRHTFLFLLEGGVWRAVQSHASVPQDYERSFGVSLTTTLSDLLDSLDVSAVAEDEKAEGLSVLMFTDIEDSTVLANTMGDAAWRSLIERHDDAIASTTGAHGGTVVKSLGDGALLKFGGARAAARCAIALQAEFAQEPFEVRIGIHAGELFHTPDDVIGATVHKAARVAAAASGGQIVVSGIVRELVGSSGFRFGEGFLADLKGIEGRHELVPLLGGDGGAT